MATEHDGMTPTEQLRAFIERVKGEHRSTFLSDMSGPRCFVHAATTEFPCDTLRAVLALEEMTKEKSVDDFAKSVKELSAAGASMSLIYWRTRAFVEEALARAAQKVSE